MHFQQVAEAYQLACASVKQAIKDSKFKVCWFIKGLGFEGSEGAFYRRLKAANWEPSHLQKLGLLLEGKEVEAGQ